MKFFHIIFEAKKLAKWPKKANIEATWPKKANIDWLWPFNLSLQLALILNDLHFKGITF